MKYLLLPIAFLLTACSATTAVVEKPDLVEPPIVADPILPPQDCSKWERTTPNSAINEWLKKELQNCLDGNQ